MANTFITLILKIITLNYFHSHLFYTTKITEICVLIKKIIYCNKYY